MKFNAVYAVLFASLGVYAAELEVIRDPGSNELLRRSLNVGRRGYQVKKPEVAGGDGSYKPETPAEKVPAPAPEKEIPVEEVPEPGTETPANKVPEPETETPANKVPEPGTPAGKGSGEKNEPEIPTGGDYETTNPGAGGEGSGATPGKGKCTPKGSGKTEKPEHDTPAAEEQTLTPAPEESTPALKKETPAPAPDVANPKAEGGDGGAFEEGYEGKEDEVVEEGADGEGSSSKSDYVEEEVEEPEYSAKGDGVKVPEAEQKEDIKETKKNGAY